MGTKNTSPSNGVSLGMNFALTDQDILDGFSLIDFQVNYPIVGEIDILKSSDGEKRSLDGAIITYPEDGQIKIDFLNTPGGTAEVLYIDTVADTNRSLSGKYFTIDSIDTAYYVWLNTGINTAEVTYIDAIADTDGSLRNTYFFIDSINDSYYVWFNIAAYPEQTYIDTVADVDGTLAGTYFTLNSPSTAYYVWFKLTPVAEITYIDTIADSNGSLGGTYFTLNSPTVPYYVWLYVAGLTEQTYVDTILDTEGSLNGTYFTLNTPSTAYYVWLSIDAIAEVTFIDTVADVSRSLGGTYFTLNTPTVAYYVWLNTGYNVAQITEVICVADVAGSLNNKYFTIDTTTVSYYVWFNVNNAGTDPAVGGKTGIEVRLATGDANTVVAEKVKVALDQLDFFSATRNSATVTVTNEVVGLVANTPTEGDSGFTVTATTEGDTASTDPAVGGKTGIEVHINPDDTDDDVATAIAGVLNPLDYFAATANTNRVTITNSVAGSATDATAGTSGFSITVSIQGLDQGIDPAIGGKTGIKVTINRDDADSVVATTIAGILNAMVGIFSASAGTNRVTVTNATVGTVTDGGVGTSGFTVTVNRQGVNNSTDPAVGGKTGIQVTILRNDADTAVATAIATVLDAMTAIFDATPSSARVTITNVVAGSATDATAGTSGFSITVNRQGVSAGTDPAVGGKTGIEIDITANDANTVIATTIANVLDAMNTVFDASANSNKVTITNVVGGNVTNATAGTSGFSSTINTNGENAGVDPAVGGKTGIEITIVRNDTNTAVALALKNVLNAMDDFVASVNSNRVTVTNADDGIVDAAIDNNTGFAFTEHTVGDIASVDPTIADRTGIEVAITPGDTNDQVAEAIKLVLDAMSTVFDASRSNHRVTVTNIDKGSVPDGDDGNSGFTLTTHTQGLTDIAEDDIVSIIAQRNKS